MKTIIRNIQLVNEGTIVTSDILIIGERIEKIAPTIDLDSKEKYTEIDGTGLFALPGAIDDQVHFRDPGLTHKATISSESMAAVAGGITSYMDMPNTIPNVLTLDLLEEKYSKAQNTSAANYSFYMGINQLNLEEALKVDNETVCGITDDGLYFNANDGILANYPDFLETLFARSSTIIALHSEDDKIIKANTDKYKAIYGENIPFQFHSKIRSEEACLEATKRVLNIAKKHNNRLHIYHVSTASEANLFDNTIPLSQKRITAEACVHHLWFNENDYHELGALIKWNPSIKTKEDQEGLLKALLEDRLDIIATDHAPHTLEEKSGTYFNAHSGGPLVQHALPAMLELYHQGKISLEKIVEKMCHNPAIMYKMKDRGFIREGYFADIVLVNLASKWEVNDSNILYKCGWSPFNKTVFSSKIDSTFVNGHRVYNQGSFDLAQFGKRLQFDKER